MRLAQGAMYAAAGVPDAYVAWSEFSLPFTCRDLGCEEYGRSWEDMSSLRQHLDTEKHQVGVPNIQSFDQVLTRCSR